MIRRWKAIEVLQNENDEIDRTALLGVITKSCIGGISLDIAASFRFRFCHPYRPSRKYCKESELIFGRCTVTYVRSHPRYCFDFFAFCQCIFSQGRVENTTIVVCTEISKKSMRKDMEKGSYHIAYRRQASSLKSE